MSENETFIAVVGGTTFGNPEKFGDGLVEREGSFTIETPVGTSPEIFNLRYNGVSFYYIPMYGMDAKKDGEPEYVAHTRTWTALYKLGVTHVIGGATAGGIKPEFDYDDIVIIDDFMEFRAERPNDILLESGYRRDGFFPNFEVPLSESLRALLIDESKKRSANYSGRIYEQGTFFQFAPGRFESPAEIRTMASLGADITSMNQATCIIYARQLGIRYGSICAISNPAVGVRPFTFEKMQASVQSIARFSVPVVLETIARIPTEAMGPEPSSTGESFTGSYLDPNSETGSVL